MPSRERTRPARPPRRPDPEPLPYNGIGTVTVLTVAWLVGLVVTVVFHARLDHQGRLWLVPTCAVGLALGLVGLAYCRRRVAAIERDRQAGREREPGS